MQKVAVTCVAIGLVAIAADLGRAQDFDTGESEFLSACAACHGVDGKGGGPAGAKLKVKPANLTTLAKRNGGLFPVNAVYASIDGRATTASHRTRAMPIWGCRSANAPAAPTAARKPKAYKLKPDDSLDLSCDSEAVIANRILAIVGYLSRIQEQ
jgi:mono/diheme cytochrome c family protein